MVKWCMNEDTMMVQIMYRHIQHSLAFEKHFISTEYKFISVNILPLKLKSSSTSQQFKYYKDH